MSALVPLATDDDGWPLLDVFWSMLWFFLWILWIFLLIRIISDIFRSKDLSGWGKAAWTFFVIILPLIAVLIYLIVRGNSMQERDMQSAAQAEQQFRSYVQSVSPSSGGTADEIAKLADLRDRGVISEAEFTAQKAKLLT